MSQTQKLTVATTREADAPLDDIIARTVQQTLARSAPPVQPMELRTFEELDRWAQVAARSRMVPKDYYGQPDNIILAVQMGSELGLRPMQSLQNIAVVNGRPAIWGDAMLALCMTHPLYRGVKETLDGQGDELAAVCVVQRQGDAPKIAKFSVADAKRAGLWSDTPRVTRKDRDGRSYEKDNDSPWYRYPTRMLQMRARGFALRDAFPDKLRGLISAEEAGDYSLEAAGITPAMSAAPPPAPEPEDRVKAGADALKARFEAVRTAQDYYAILDEPKTATQMAYLKVNRPELFEVVDSARATAATTMQDAPDDGSPGPKVEGGR